MPLSYIGRFLPLDFDIEGGQQVTPCFSSERITYLHIRRSNVYRELSILDTLLN